MRMGIDLGGTKIEVAMLDDSNAERFRHRIPAPRNDYRATLAAIAALVALAEREAGCCRAIGIAIPGSLSPRTGLVRNANSTWLNGRPLREDLERLLGRPARLSNDANCFALSEAADGAAAGLAVVFGVILGTGVGGGIAVDGRLLSGANGIAGEWGHNPLPAPLSAEECPGPPCWCGRHGCIETWLSGPGLAGDFRRLGADSPDQDAEAVIAAMRRGDGRARAAFERYCDRLARALAGVINLLDPDAIVLGGGLSNIDELYGEVPERWAPHVFADCAYTPLLRNRHGDSSGVRGAVRLNH